MKLTMKSHHSGAPGIYCCVLLAVMLPVFHAAVAAVPSDAVIQDNRNDADDAAWNEFLTEHGIKYHNPNEEAMRKALFLETDKMIKEHNANKSATWTMGHNKFSIMTAQEKRTFGGLLLPVQPYDDSNVILVKSESLSLPRQRPVTLDLSTQPCMPPPRDQAGCGSCWSFASLTPIEYAYCKKFGFTSPLDFSEQQLLDCSPLQNGCDGGWVSTAWIFLRNHLKYVVTEGAYPYYAGMTRAAGDECRQAKTSLESRASTAAMNTFTIRAGDHETIANALYIFGPIAAAIETSPLYSYSSGVITTTPECSNLPRTAVGHAVVIVGYGEEADKNTPNAVMKYWLVRNSWGTWWGENGYFKILRGTNLCNIESWPSFITL